MMKTMSRLVVTASAASMAFAPIAVQANTRASDSGTVYTSASVSQPGVGRSDEGEDVYGRSGILLAILAAAAIIGGLIIILDDDDGNQSPGAN
jgi:hypothetical protein